MAKFNFSLSSKADNAGYHQVMIRYTVSRDIRFRLKSGVWVNPVYFDDDANRIVVPKKGRLNYGEVRAAETAKNQLESFVNRVDKICSAMRSHEESLTAEYVMKAMKATSEINVNDISYYSITSEIEAMEEKEKEAARSINNGLFDLLSVYLTKVELSAGRKRSFCVLARQLYRYQSFIRATDKERKNFKLSVGVMDTETLEDFFDYYRNEKELSVEYPELFKKIMNDYPSKFPMKNKKHILEERGKNTFVRSMKMFKAFFKWCNQKRFTDNNPFNGVKIGLETYGTPYYLTLDERNIIADVDLQKACECLNDDDKNEVRKYAPMPISSLIQQRDIFIFQCLIGCRVGDLLKLTPSNVINGTVEYIAGKTKEKKPRTVEVPLNGRAKALVDKYKGVDDKGRLMPFIAPQNYNNAIKAILLICGINRNVTIINPTTGEAEQRPIWKVASSHMARRTFIGTLYKLVQDPNLIGSMSGHTDGSKAFARYRAIDEDMKKKCVSLID